MKTENCEYYILIGASTILTIRNLTVLCAVFLENMLLAWKESLPKFFICWCRKVGEAVYVQNKVFFKYAEIVDYYSVLHFFDWQQIV